jgi:hypothetical protein
MAIDADFLAGVIEGFYGPPWSQSERFQLFRWMKHSGLNTYFYAPKDDLKHRALWRELYYEEEAAKLREVIEACKRAEIRFIYGIAPGLDIRYADDSELVQLKERLEQMRGLGCEAFALLFDDIPERMRYEDKQRFGTFGNAQSFIANSLYSFLPLKSRFLFCPTLYCERMAQAKPGGVEYLETLGEKLAPEIDVFWTGREIISELITGPDARRFKGWLKRKPMIWDNLHANDYDGRRFFVGPYSGRPVELLDEVSGILSNPNCELPLNFVPLRTFGDYVRRDGREARDRYLGAMSQWLTRFETIRGPLDLKELVLFGDCFYLPFEDGLDADWMFSKTRNALLKGGTTPEELAVLREFCMRLPELENRPLFYALSRRVWDLREEIDLLEKFLQNPSSKFRSDFHLPGTFRGGFVARLQTLLKQKEDGTFSA